MTLKIGNKLALVLMGLSLVVIALIGSLFYFQFERALEERVLLQLSSVKRLKASQITSDLKEYINLIKEFKDSNDSLLFDHSHLIAVKVAGEGLKQVSVAGYPVTIPQSVPQYEVIIQDQTTNDESSEITLALISPLENDVLVAIVKPDIQSILLERTGLGETGESYLVGPDKIMRSTSRFFPEQRPIEIIVDTKGVNRALAGDHGVGMFKDYRGIEVFSSYELLDYYGLKWVILSEIDRQEAFIPLGELRTNFFIALLVILLFVLAASYWLSRQIVKPIVVMENKLTEMSMGNIGQSIPDRKREDEIGKMFHGLNRLVYALNQAVDFAREMGNENFDAKYELLSDRDKLGSALLQMKAELKSLKENEAKLVMENQRAIISGEENERSRLSRDLHDGVGPLLTTLRLKVQMEEIPERTKKELSKVIDETIHEVRRMSNNLMPSVLEDFGAGEAIGNLTKSLKNDGVDIRYRYEKNEKVVIPKSVNIALYRIVQEAITNILRHAEASEIKISLTEFEEVVSLFIFDNGKGFDTSKHHTGKGLINIKERVKLEGGIINFDSGSEGTKIEVEIPVK